jgi:hypothetical protein
MLHPMESTTLKRANWLACLAICLTVFPETDRAAPPTTTTSSPPSSSPPPSGGWAGFTNETFASGFESLEDLGGHGVQVADVDGDGWLDVYVTHIFDPA